MFENMKNLANLGGMMAKARQLQEKMEELKGKLAEVTAEAEAGGGMVHATCNGRLELVKLRIDAKRLEPGKASEQDLELLEDLIVAAVAAAQQKATAKAQEEMSRLAEEMGLPPGMLGGANPGGGMF